MGKQAFKYILVCMGIYLGISAIEIFLLESLVDFISTKFWIHFIVYIILLLVVNPILTRIISDKIGFESDELIKEDGQ